MKLFVVFEGLDATGKSTVAALLGRKLNTKPLSTPPDSLRAIRPVLDSTYRESGLASQLFYASTVSYVSSLAGSAIKRGLPVVLDRYWVSTLVYNELRAGSVDLSAVERTLTPATLTVLLYTSEEERRRRLIVRGATDADLASMDYFQRLQEKFERLIHHPVSGRVLRIDTSGLSPEHCVEVITTYLDGHE